jgi:Lrp/AsnC family transcriptional regulator, leucine-responsive regulatory protein
MPTKTNISQELDVKDRAILALVQRDAKMLQTEIAKRVGLSAAAVNERLRKLDRAGVIRRYTAQVDARAVGASVTAFVEVFIEQPRFEREFIEKLLQLDEVQECHHITGEFSLLLKVRVRDMEQLRDLLLQEFNSFEGVRQTRTIMVLSTVKEESFVATGVQGEPS